MEIEIGQHKGHKMAVTQRDGKLYNYCCTCQEKLAIHSSPSVDQPEAATPVSEEEEEEEQKEDNGSD